MRPSLTYANVVATLALIIAVGGASAFAATQLAKNSVGSKQIKKNAVTTAKIKQGAVTGAKVNLATLGVVPKADQANQANSAGHANSADSARTAGIAESLSASEAWHVVGASGEPQFQNDCKPGKPVKFFRDHDEIVHLEGQYESCTSTGVTGFQLPIGYRPDQLLQLALPFAGAGAAIAIFETIPEGPQVSGAVKCGEEACDLDGISFRAEP